MNKHIKQAPVIWLLGLSGAGKTTIAYQLQKLFTEANRSSLILDGDELRLGINKDLGFSKNDRAENIRRTAELASIVSNNGIITICSLITPLQQYRTLAASIIGERYYEIFVDCPLEICEQRDVKGLYQKAKTGELKEFTGISSSFESPVAPFLKVHSYTESSETCARLIFDSIGF
ncbi:MAG: adenylyl-sulfate kinase [Niabella sp.]|nr:adenylyl-sulfate kinase [Niabella sp.]